MKRLVSVLIMVTILFSGCAVKQKPPTANSNEAIVKAVLQALSNDDVATGLNLLADDAVWRQDPPGIKAEGKDQVESILRQNTLWHHRHSITSPPKIEGDKVTFSAQVTGDDFRIMGMEFIRADYEFHIRDGKISSWLSIPRTDDWNKLTEHTAGGVGIRFEIGQQGPKVKDFVKDSPGRDAGLRIDDSIIAVNGVQYSEMRPGEWQIRVRGPIGSKVHLTVVRAGETNPVDVQVTRADYGAIWK